MVVHDMAMVSLDYLVKTQKERIYGNDEALSLFQMELLVLVNVRCEHLMEDARKMMEGLKNLNGPAMEYGALDVILEDIEELACLKEEM